MIEILWEFVVREGKVTEFEQHYGEPGPWAQLFARSPAWRGTTLMRGSGRRYVTRDRWENLEAFRDFRSRHAVEYDALDRACEALTESEREIGIFEVI